MNPSTRNYNRILDLACSVLDDTAGDLPHALITTELMHILPSSGGYFLELRWHQRSAHATGISADWTTKPLASLYALYLTEHPLLRHYGLTGDRTVLTAAAVAGTRAWHHGQIRHASQALLQADQHLALPLRSPDGVVRMFALGRPTDHYSASEMITARTIQSILVGLDNHLEVYGNRQAGLRHDHLDELMAEYHLTPREITVLTLLAKALPAKQIATRLDISPRTVHKHVENLYRKLRSTDQVSAVRRAQSIGLLPTSQPPPPGQVILASEGQGSPVTANPELKPVKSD